MACSAALKQKSRPFDENRSRGSEGGGGEGGSVSLTLSGAPAAPMWSFARSQRGANSAERPAGHIHIHIPDTTLTGIFWTAFDGKY